MHHKLANEFHGGILGPHAKNASCDRAPLAYMLKSSIVRLVAWSMSRPVRVILISLILAVLSGYYVAHHFKINTDISRLVENDQAWSSLDDAIDNAFPQRGRPCWSSSKRAPPNSPTPPPMNSPLR